MKKITHRQRQRKKNPVKRLCRRRLARENRWKYQVSKPAAPSLAAAPSPKAGGMASNPSAIPLNLRTLRLRGLECTCDAISNHRLYAFRNAIATQRGRYTYIVRPISRVTFPPTDEVHDMRGNKCVNFAEKKCSTQLAAGLQDLHPLRVAFT